MRTRNEINSGYLENFIQETTKIITNYHKSNKHFWGHSDPDGDGVELLEPVSG